MRVLIADDQRNWGTVLADMVRCCGHEVVAIVGSGVDAIYAYTLHKPDLVLMDHWMPRLNGVTASRHIIAKYPAARIVLLSAWSPLDGADESGAICFLPKPVDLARLNATLLTISQTLPPSNSEVHSPISDLLSPKSELRSPSSEPFPSDLVPVPPEIISPVETFPVATFPIAGLVPQNDAGHAGTGDDRSTIRVKKSRKRRRNSRRRSRAC